MNEERSAWRSTNLLRATKAPDQIGVRVQKENNFNSASALRLSKDLLFCVNTRNKSHSYSTTLFNTNSSSVAEIPQNFVWNDLQVIQHDDKIKFLISATDTVSLYSLDKNMSIKEEKRNFFKQKSNEVIFSHLTVNQSTFDFIGISQKSCYLWENVKNDYTEFSWKDYEVTASQWHNGLVEGAFILGSKCGKISLWDKRDLKKPQQSINTSQPSPYGISDLRVNPFVPHWWAVAGSEGIIMYDERMLTEPLCTINNHYSTVNYISWSTSHCEIIASGSLDGSMNFTSLPHSPAICSLPNFSVMPIVGVEFSNIAQNMCYTLSSLGEIKSITLTTNFLTPLAPSRFDSDLLGKEAEKTIYSRSIQKGFEKAIEVAQTAKLNQNPKSALKLLSACQKQEILSFHAGSSKGIHDHFLKELKHYTYLIPPNYVFPKIDEAIQKQIQKSIVELEIQKNILTGNETTYDKWAEKIFQLLHANSNSIDPQIISQFIQKVMGINQNKSFLHLEKLVHIYQSSGDFINFVRILSPILSPSIYDHPQLLQVKMEEVLMNPKDCLDQIHLLSMCIGRGYNLAKLLNDSEFLSLSSLINLSNLNTLLKNEQFDMLFSMTSRLTAATKGFPFAEEISNFMNNKVLPKIENYLNTKIQPLDKTLSPSEMVAVIKNYEKMVHFILVTKSAKYSSSLPEKLDNQFYRSFLEKKFIEVCAGINQIIKDYLRSLYAFFYEKASKKASKENEKSTFKFCA